MRITAVTLIGFTGVADELSLDLDSNVVVLVGANGFGKTTICDAIAWALTGIHPRDADPRSLYSRTGETQVLLRLRRGDGGVISVRRSVANPNEAHGGRIQTTCVIETNEGRFRGAEAETALFRELMPRNDGDEGSARQTTLLYSYYMQQESLREFLSNRSDDERFTALSRMVGAGGLSQLVKEFETAKTAWSRATNKADQELVQLRSRVEQLTSQRAGLQSEVGQSITPDAIDRWGEWWSLTEQALERGTSGSDQAHRPEPSAQALESRVAALSAHGRAMRRTQSELEAVLAEAAIPAPELPDQNEIAALEAAVAAASAAVEVRQQELGAARGSVAAAQAELRTVRTLRNELAALAELALRHVGSECPTCGQAVDLPEFESRLRALVAARDVDVQPPALSDVLAAEASADEALSTAQAQLQEATTEYQSRSRARAAGLARREQRASRLQELGLDLASLAPDDSEAAAATAVQRRLDQINSALGQLAELSAQSETFQMLFTAARAQSRLRQVEADLAASGSDLASKEDDIRERRTTGTRADQMMQALRMDADEFVNSRLSDIQPMLDQLYAAVDPHPTFRSVRLATRLFYGKPRLDPVVADDAADVEATDPGKTLSTSQANALAVTLFLSFNLGLTPSRLETVVLDDPLQSLDDVHLLGLVDLLRRVVPYRQLILTTHDAGFASLLSRKLRPVSVGSRGRVLRISKWDRAGPEIDTEEIAADLQPIKIAEAG